MIDCMNTKKSWNHYCKTIENCYNKDAFSNAHIEIRKHEKRRSGSFSFSMCRWTEPIRVFICTKETHRSPMKLKYYFFFLYFSIHSYRPRTSFNKAGSVLINVIMMLVRQMKKAWMFIITPVIKYTHSLIRKHFSNPPTSIYT